MVARFDLDSVSLAQKPKSAVWWLALLLLRRWSSREELTNLDVPASIQENVVGLDIAVDDLLRVKVVQATASLSNVRIHKSHTVTTWDSGEHTSRQMVEI